MYESRGRGQNPEVFRDEELFSLTSRFLNSLPEKSLEFYLRENEEYERVLCRFSRREKVNEISVTLLMGESNTTLHFAITAEGRVLIDPLSKFTIAKEKMQGICKVMMDRIKREVEGQG